MRPAGYLHFTHPACIILKYQIADKMRGIIPLCPDGRRARGGAPRIAITAPKDVRAAMKMQAGKWQKAFILCLSLCFLFFGCSAGTEGFEGDGTPMLSNPEFVRTPPPLKLAEYVGTNEVTKDDPATGRSGLVDLTNVNQGYVAVKAVASEEAMLRVTKTSGGAADLDDYRFESNDEIVFVPITRGSGEYNFQLMFRGEELGDGNAMYYPLLSTDASVSLADEFAPFSVQNIYVNYNADSELIDFSYDLAQHASTDLEVAQQIYYWIANNVTYDTFKAQQVSGKLMRNYIPEPDETLSTKKGICYDFASLAAAMLRANGIPCKLIKGDVNTGDGSNVYHAWNLFYTAESGWIAVKLAASGNAWTQIDLTFAAGRGSSLAEFIGDGENYTPQTEY